VGKEGTMSGGGGRREVVVPLEDVEEKVVVWARKLALLMVGVGAVMVREAKQVIATNATSSLRNAQDTLQRLDLPFTCRMNAFAVVTSLREGVLVQAYAEDDDIRGMIHVTMIDSDPTLGEE